MVSGSQLQFAKLAQMCPAAPSGAQQPPVATRVKTQPGAPSDAQRHQTVQTSAFLEHITHRFKTSDCGFT